MHGEPYKNIFKVFGIVRYRSISDFIAPFCITCQFFTCSLQVFTHFMVFTLKTPRGSIFADRTQKTQTHGSFRYGPMEAAECILFTPADLCANVVWTFHTFENNFIMKHLFKKYLKRSCGLGCDQHFFLKYYSKYNVVVKISPKLSGCFRLVQA